ncbi:MAG: plasmid mobilization protein, partial [Oscillospiraceae bacterium]
MRKNQYNLHIRLDEDERAALEKGLQASGLPLSVYLRRLILGESIQAAPSEELRRLRAEIHQIGNNINQLARKANAGFA